MISYTLGEIAKKFDLGLRGNAEHRVTGMASLSKATSEQLSFLANTRYRQQLRQTQAAAVILHQNEDIASHVQVLYSKNPYVDFARISNLFVTQTTPVVGIHPTSVIDSLAHIDQGASIGPHCVVGAHSVVAAGAILGSGCIVGPRCVIGENTHLIARVTLVQDVVLSQRVCIHPGAVIGADGFGIAMDNNDHWLKVPQLGGVHIGDDCEIGANTTIDRGTLSDTILENDVRLDNQIQIGHNVVVGAHTAMAGCVAIAGSAKIGSYCLLGGGAGIVGHIDICDHVTITAMSLVTHSIKQPGIYSSGVPLQENKQWRKNAVRFSHLDAFVRQYKHVKKCDTR